MNFQEFEKNLKDVDARGIKILQLAMTLAAIMMTGMLLFVGLNGGTSNETNQDMQFINIISAMTAMATFGGITLFSIFPKIRNKRKNLDQIFSAEDTVASFMNHFRPTRILQLAVLEGPAILGAVSCFLALQGGILPEQSIYWLNLAPCLLFLLVSLATFPSKNYLYGRFRNLQEIQSY